MGIKHVREYNDHGHLIKEEYYLNEKRHKEDGPAVQCWNDDGQLKYQGYWLNGTPISKDDFLARQKQSCHGKIVEIDGKKYQLSEVKS